MRTWAATKCRPRPEFIFWMWESAQVQHKDPLVGSLEVFTGTDVALIILFSGS